jgi:hypothetical protein
VINFHFCCTTPRLDLAAWHCSAWIHAHLCALILHRLDGPPVVVAMGGIGSGAMPGAAAAAMSPARPISTLPVSEDSYYPDQSSSHTSSPGGANYHAAQGAGAVFGGRTGGRSPVGPYVSAGMCEQRGSKSDV